MNKVIGKVLVRETGQGVPNLVVVLFDRDPTTPSVPAAGSPPSTSPTTDASFGERIGSVLTGANGDFELTFDSSLFAAGDPEKRPDLLLGVFAPEDSRGLDQPTPLPPVQRLLLFSNVARQDAGQMEAYVLRVSREQLKRFGIPFPGSVERADPKEHAAQVIAAYASRDELTKHIREGLAPMRKARLQRHREIATAAKKFVKKLGAASLAQRALKNFVGPDNDFTSAVRAAMEKGLTALQNLTSAGPVIWEITQQDLAAGGLTTPGVVELLPAYEELTHEQLCRIIGRRRGGMALERVMDLVQAQKSEADAKRRVELITTPPPDGGGQPAGQGEPPPALPNGEDAITTGVLGQLTDLTVPAAKPAATIEELSARLMGFTLPPGPADVTSFHDFHQLQIAFEHVWTEAFDKDLKERIRVIFEESRHEEFGVQFDSFTEASETFEVEELLAEMQGVQTRVGEEAPPQVQDYLPDAAQRWFLFSETQQAALTLIAFDLEPLYLPGNQEPLLIGDPVELHARAQAIIAQPAGRGGRLTRLLDETRQRLTEPYAFHYFAPNSVNFGILLTYRQKWAPLTYQVGDLVSTIPLAPGEVRRFSSKTVIKRTRAQKELEKSLSSRSGESTLTQRADAEITAKASSTTNFKHTAQGSFNFGIGNLEATAEFVMSQAQESASIKKSFREGVIKAASEYKQERALEIETTQESSVETSTSGEIANTNNEMTVTYLLYELERQYRISERIHRVMPVILVAQDVPGPHEITESWLLAHEWILRRVLLDDGLAPALDQLKESFAGDELAVGIKKANWKSQRSIVEKLEAAVAGFISDRDALRQSLLSSEYSKALAKAADDAGGWLSDLAEGLTVDLTGAAVDTLEAGVKNIRKQLDYLQESLGEAQQRLGSSQEALNSAAKEYTQAIEAQTNRRVAIDQLRVHVKQNILYYMQAIWDHEPPDQRFFRLYYRPVDLPEAATSTCRLRLATEEELALGIETICRKGNYYVIEGCEAPQLPDPDNPNTKQLVEIADLDHPLGYKGNYIIFPLKTCVYLTEFMMKEFMDGYLGVRDPDRAANYTTDEVLTYLEKIWVDPAITLSDKEREAVLSLVINRVREPRRESDIVVVPTGQIYIEALLGSHPLLEPFKQVHRAYDVGKARAELRQAELDNLRRAARLIAGEREDPDIEKKIVIEGDSQGVIVSPDA